MPQATDDPNLKDPALTAGSEGADPGAAGDQGNDDGSPKSIFEQMQEQFGALPEGEQPPGEPGSAKDGAPADPAKPAEPGKTPDGQPPVKPEGQAPPAKPEGAENPLYRIPQGLRGEHRKAYVELVNHARSLEGKAKEADTLQERMQAATSTMETFHNVIQDARATPEQMAAAFDFLKAVNTGSVDAAIQMLQGQLVELGKLSGRPIPGLDAKAQLEGFPDLQEAVANAQITQEHAIELAKSRRLQAHSQRQEADQRSQQEARARFETEKRTAMTEVNKFLSKRAETDVDYQKKERIVAEKVRDLIQGVPPSLWPQKIALYYDSLVVPKDPPKPEPNPLRSKTGGAAVAQAKTAEEALRLGLGYTT